MIEFRDVKKRFGEREVLNGLSFTVENGEIVFLLGRSGTGKSVCLKHIVGLLRPDSGEILVDGREVSRLSEESYFEVRRRCGMVFQFPALLDSLTVFENVVFGMRAHCLCAPLEEKAKVIEKLGLVNLDKSILGKFPAELSFGMQKRVSLARTLALDPEYLLFDEPTTSLDPVTTTAIHELIRSLSKKLKVTSLVVSHDMHGALSVSDRVLLLDGGRIVEQGTPAQMKRSEHPLAKAFLRRETER